MTTYTLKKNLGELPAELVTLRGLFEEALAAAAEGKPFTGEEPNLKVTVGLSYYGDVPDEIMVNLRACPEPGVRMAIIQYFPKHQIDVLNSAPRVLYLAIYKEGE